MEQLIGYIMDLGVGGVAIKLVLSLEKSQKLQTELLVALTKRVEVLERFLERERDRDGA